ncbi:MAG TPA: hypothetical protein PL098_00120 [Brevundimonas diminuta]|nr:hypothetical protein [Brevundimonas diminuta]HRL23309.1 hypothetical protein [Brevundimonas diminuta]
MTDKLFHEIPEAQVVLRCKGVYRQAKLFHRDGHVYAAWGSGFVRLLSGSGTTVPSVSWHEGDTLAAPRALELNAASRKAPRWAA